MKWVGEELFETSLLRKRNIFFATWKFATQPKNSLRYPCLPSFHFIWLIFGDSWFSVTMGTGIVSILLHNLPYNGSWLRYISIIIFVLNIFLFVLFTMISILRYTLYPEIWGAMIRHPAQSLFLGTFPMGLATIINMTVFVVIPVWGHWAVTLVSFTWFFSTTVY